MESAGFITFDNELMALVNASVHVDLSLKSNPFPTADLIRTYKTLSTPANASERRKAKSIQVAISNRQTLQVNLLLTYERGIDVIH
jgi:hypothetical protein